MPFPIFTSFHFFSPSKLVPSWRCQQIIWIIIIISTEEGMRCNGQKCSLSPPTLRYDSTCHYYKLLAQMSILLLPLLLCYIITTQTLHIGVIIIMLSTLEHIPLRKGRKISHENGTARLTIPSICQTSIKPFFSCFLPFFPFRKLLPFSYLRSINGSSG